MLHFLDGSDALDSVWDIEFETVGDTDAGAGLTRIDHLAQTMSFDDMLSWTLFYTAIFDMTKRPMVDVIDPDGLVRSQAIATADGALRITLNGADTYRTLAGQLLSSTFGAPLQHMAFATDDIFATADTLAANGFEVLPMTTNYYDDLAARFGLTPADRDRLATRNILYDRDERGEYFQLYSAGLTGGLFVEIVERRGGYAGYGAPNAPFRIAAQKRLVSTKGVPAH